MSLLDDDDHSPLQTIQKTENGEQDKQAADTIPLADVQYNDDVEAIYQRRCAAIISRSQPAIKQFKDADAWAPATASVSFTLPPNDPANPDAPGSRLHRLKFFPNPGSSGVMVLQNFPYLLDLLNHVAHGTDLPQGYDPWLMLFTAWSYLDLPSMIVDRVCEDLLWGLGGCKEAFQEVFKFKSPGRWSMPNWRCIILMSSDEFLSQPSVSQYQAHQYISEAFGALEEYLHRTMMGNNHSPVSYNFYELSVRFTSPNDHEAKQNRNTGCISYYVPTSTLGNCNPRMLHHLLQSSEVPVLIDMWPVSRFSASADDAATFAEMLCAHMHKTSTYAGNLAVSMKHVLLKLAGAGRMHFEFANIILCNLHLHQQKFDKVTGESNDELDSDSEEETPAPITPPKLWFDVTHILAAAIHHSREAYAAWRSFVESAEILRALHCAVPDTMGVASLQCALLMNKMLDLVTDEDLQTHMLRSLQRCVFRRQRADGEFDDVFDDEFGTFARPKVSNIISRVFVDGRVADIRRLHALGLDIALLREDVNAVRANFMEILKFAEEQQWLSASNTQYRHKCMENLVLHSAHDAIQWLCAHYPDTVDALWSKFCRGKYLYKRSCREKHITRHHLHEEKRAIPCHCKERRRKFGKAVQWLLQQNRDHWHRQLPKKFVSLVIERGDYRTLRALYRITGLRPKPHHINAVLELNTVRYHITDCNGNDVRSMVSFSMLWCIWDVLRETGTKFNLSSLLTAETSRVNLKEMAWIVRRGFFNTPGSSK
jgi:hypothetical protein